MSRRYHPTEGLWESAQGFIGLALVYITSLIALLVTGVVVVYVGLVIIDIVSGWPRP